MTVREALLQVQALREQARYPEALAAIVDAKARLPRVPPNLLALEGDTRLRLGQPEAAADLLRQALDGPDGAPAPVWVPLRLGDALLEADRGAEAGAAFLRARRRGHPLDQPRRFLAALLAAEAGEADELRGEITRATSFHEARSRALYVAIPKNACTVLKASLVLNSGERDAYRASGRDVHTFLARSRLRSPDPALFRDADVAKFVLFRNPFDRLLSAYLDKLVRRFVGDNLLPFQVEVVRRAQARLGIPFDLRRSLSFAEFVRFLAETPDHFLDQHWLPQSALVQLDLAAFEHVGRFERLSETLAFLEDRLGWEAVADSAPHLADAALHRARYDENLPSRDWSGLTAPEWAALGPDVPVPSRVYTPDLAQAVAARYAADVAIYRRLDPAWTGEPS